MLYLVYDLLSVLVGSLGGWGCKSWDHQDVWGLQVLNFRLTAHNQQIQDDSTIAGHLWMLWIHSICASLVLPRKWAFLCVAFTACWKTPPATRGGGSSHDHFGACAWEETPKHRLQVGIWMLIQNSLRLSSKVVGGKPPQSWGCFGTRNLAWSIPSTKMIRVWLSGSLDNSMRARWMDLSTYWSWRWSR